VDMSKKIEKSILEWVEEIGRQILDSDKKDIGKFDRLHHWQIGLPIMLLGALGRLGAIIEEAIKKIEEMIE